MDCEGREGGGLHMAEIVKLGRGCALIGSSQARLGFLSVVEVFDFSFLGLHELGKQADPGLIVLDGFPDHGIGGVSAFGMVEKLFEGLDALFGAGHKLIQTSCA